MPQKYRIYINENSLFISDFDLTTTSDYQLIDTQNFDFGTFYKNLRKADKRKYLLPSNDPKRVLKAIKRKCEFIKAAGGLVRNQRGEFLFIYRNNRWDLPKGKVEEEEKNKVAAVREVEEECGVTVSRLGARVCRTYHIYEMNGRVILKCTSWYNMDVEGNPDLVPQEEEGITSAMWVPRTAIAEKLTNTYPSIVDVISFSGLN